MYINHRNTNIKKKIILRSKYSLLLKSSNYSLKKKKKNTPNYSVRGHRKDYMFKWPCVISGIIRHYEYIS